MQRVKYIPSDFYGDWTNLKLELEVFKEHQLGQYLLEELKHREVSIITSPIILASVFIDPRYRVLLSEAENLTAIEHIMKLKRRLEINGEVEPIASTENNENNRYTKLSALITQKKSSNPYYRHNADGTEFLRNLLTLPVELDLDVSPIEYWAKRKQIFPDIYKIHCVLNAAAPTQASVERDFSGFSYILRPQRTKFKPNRLSNVLILRLNPTLWLKNLS